MLSPRCAKARTTSAVTAALAAELVAELVAELAALFAALLAALLVVVLIGSAVFVCVSPPPTAVGGTVAVGVAATPSIHPPLADWDDFKNSMPLSIASSACANVTGAIGTSLGLVLTRRMTGGGGSNEVAAVGTVSVVARAATGGVAVCAALHSMTHKPAHRLGQKINAQELVFMAKL
jgi:hypothetical protein